jgi:hypothetical protein
MSIIDSLKQSVHKLTAPKQTNSMGSNLANSFLRYGGRPMTPEWSQVVMRDEDTYSGYTYAAIRNRANMVAEIAAENVRAWSPNKTNRPHPYLTLIQDSKNFSERAFWYSISTYEDLEGVYYLMALRNVRGTRYGAVQGFKLLNPYQIRRVVNSETMEVAGYVETKGGRTREIPPHMIIEIRELNPFSDDQPFAMTDAAKESQFTLRQVNDYTRNALQGNINAPGIISTDVMLDDDRFQQFVDRVKGHGKGEPIFGNGSGAITWQDMQTDLNKASLKDISEVNRQLLIAVSGSSKTSLGLEESGTTRDTARVQKELSVEGHILPRIRLILDSLNQDYKQNYPDDYSTAKLTLVCENPLKADLDADLKKTEVSTKQLDLYNKMVAEGYDPKVAAGYANGTKDITEIGLPKPKPEPKPEPGPAPEPPEEPEELETKENACDCHSGHIAAVSNQLDDAGNQVVMTQQGSLKNTIMGIEERVVVSVLSKVTDNQYDEQSDIIDKKDRDTYEEELAIALLLFYGVMFPLHGSSTIQRRLRELGIVGSFRMTTQVKEYIGALSKKVATGHIDTILEDVLVVVRQASLSGAGREELVAIVKKEYNDTISKFRAETIARTETNRAYTRAQYEADAQLIADNGLQGRAFKKWVTRSGNPCPICQSLASEPPIPFGTPFREFGDEMTVTYEENEKTRVRSMTFDFETLDAGNAHPNCQCAYQLIIE